MPYPPLPLLLFLFLLAGSLSAQEKKPFTQMDVFGLEWVTAPQISPDGDWIAYQRRGMDIMKDRRSSRLWLIKADGSGHRKLTSNDVNESAAVWSPDGSRLAFVSGSDQGSEIYVYWLESGVLARLTQLERSPSGLSWSPDGTQLAFSMFVPGQELKLVSGLRPPKGAEWPAAPRVTTRLKHEADGAGYLDPGFAHYFVVSAEGGVPRQVTSGDFHHRGSPQWTPDGKSLVFSANRVADWEYRFRNSEVYHLDVASGDIVPLTDRDGPDRAPAVSPNGKQILYLGYPDKVQTYQVARVYLMNADGTDKREIPLNLDRSVSDVAWSADGKGFYFQYDDEGSSLVGYATLDGKHEVVVKNVGGTSVARPYSGGSFSTATDGTIAFTLTSPYHPAELAIQPAGAAAPRQLTRVSQSLLAYRELGRLEEVRYNSSVDGRDVQGWVVYPPDFDEAEVYPLLIENHGGPIASYGPHFSPEVQLYASAGFAVFYPNPRGSTSYGEEFGNLLYHDYPGEDYNDVMDGVDELLKRSYFSEDSLFVTGGSAGGIMTAWMIGKNNRFRSAAVVKPVMNWISKTLTADNYYGYAYSRYPGQPWENPMEYWKYSPISLVANVQTPTLVMVGSADLRTPLSEAKQLYHALKLRKIETALVEVPDAYHFIANRPSQLIAKVDHIVAWFNRYR